MFKSTYFIFCLFIVLSTMAQNRTVNGNIILDQNKPATDVLVLLQGTQKSAITDEFGDFTIVFP